MIEHGSPGTGESTEYPEIHNGRRCRVVEKDSSRHTRDCERVDWDTVPDSGGWRVYEYAEPRDVSADYPEEVDGRRFRVVTFDMRKHGVGNLEWVYDENGKRTQLIRDYMPRSRRGREPEPAATGQAGSEDALGSGDAKRAASRADKFAYHKALRGRFGKGRELTETEYIVLSVLWDYADGDLSNARPGNTRLAQDLGYSGPHAARTAGAHVKSLERKRFVVCTRRSGGRGSAATYRLTLPEWEVPRPQ